MDKSDIVRTMFKKGILLSPEELESATNKNIGGSGGDVAGGTEKPAVNIGEEKERLGIEDVLSFYQDKYDKLKTIISEKLNPVSIVNVGKGFSEVSIIGMVRNKTASGFVVEDMTGRVEVVSKEGLEPGDVVGVKGHAREGKLVDGEVVWPDVPLPKDVKRFHNTIVLTRKRVKGGGLQLVFGDGDAAGVAVYVPKSPAQVGLHGVKILVFEGDGSPQEWLKKRHLPEKVSSPQDFYVIKDVPDVLWVLSNENKAETYKGVTIVKTADRGFARVNLFTHKVELLTH